LEFQAGVTLCRSRAIRAPEFASAFSRAFHAILERLPMAYENNSPFASSRARYQEFRLRATWGERVVTTIAIGIAVLTVATIAVLMGMA
jgi:hypothetical protein